jgi:hypothetical protein
MSSGGGQARLLVWSQGEVWRWTYSEAALNGGGPFNLDSSIAFPDAQEARSAAEVAFPGVPVEVRIGEAPDRGGPDRGGPTGRTPSVLPELAVAALLAVVVLVVPDGGRLVAAWARYGRERLAEVLARPATRRVVRPWPPEQARRVAPAGRAGRRS